MEEKLSSLQGALKSRVEAMPKAMLQDSVIHGTILCTLRQAVEEMGYIAVPNWKPPRSTRDSIDLVAVEPGTDPPVVKMAYSIDALVELAKVKALDWVECETKVMVTYHQRADKVSQSTFFLTPGLIHINLYD